MCHGRLTYSKFPAQGDLVGFSDDTSQIEFEGHFYDRGLVTIRDLKKHTSITAVTSQYPSDFEADRPISESARADKLDANKAEAAEVLGKPGSVPAQGGQDAK